MMPQTKPGRQLSFSILSLMLALLLCLPLTLPALGQSFTVVAETAIPGPTPLVPLKTPVPFESYPSTDADGFLTAPLEKDGPAYIYANEEVGRWLYVSTDLRVEIERRLWRDAKKRAYFYFISDIRFKGDQHFRAYNKNPEKPERGTDKPENIAKQHNLVYAQNGDLFTWRVSKKKYPGIIIRNGKIVREQTYRSRNTNTTPLDELSLYADGHVEIHNPGELTGAQYLEKGALDVFSFGPILIRDGVKDDRLEGGYYKSFEPRSAIGVVGPGHFKGIMVEGRNKRSVGAGLSFVADRLLEEGCTDAFTLDGGQTAAMVFMGKTVMDPGTYNGYTKTRAQPDVIGIGVSTQKVPKKSK